MRTPTVITRRIANADKPPVIEVIDTNQSMTRKESNAPFVFALLVHVALACVFYSMVHQIRSLSEENRQLRKEVDLELSELERVTGQR